MSRNFKPLFNKEGQEKPVSQIPGRHQCECQASKHGLINNCTSCGRVVCGQEGSGPCYFCGALVCSKSEEIILQKESKKSMALRGKLMKKQKDDQLMKQLKAIEHKNKLLEFDDTCAKRTRVIDDESDYYSTGLGSWLTKKERDVLSMKEKNLRDKRFSSRLDRKYLLDFSGRHQETVEPIYDEIFFTEENKTASIKTLTYGRQKPPKFLNDNIEKPAIEQAQEEKLSKAKVQYDDQLENSDLGLCLSMHQPWASLLVKGIKKTEGRSWYSAHRGRLWIASTSKKPTEETVKTLENHYKETGEIVEFPKTYPTSSLLGCVDVEDVVQKCEEGPSMYSFICANPQELRLKFAIKGQHKIYKLDQRTLRAAQKGLEIIT